MLKKNIYMQYVLVILAGILLAVMLYCMIPRFIQKTTMFSSMGEHNLSDQQATAYLMDDSHKNHTMLQPITPDFNYLTAVGVKYTAYGNANGGTVTLELMDDTTGASMDQVSHDLLTIKEGAYTEYHFPNAIAVNPDHQYSLRLKVNSSKKGNVFGVYVAELEEGAEQKLSIDGQETLQGLSFAQYGYNEGSEKKGVFLCILMAFGILTAMAVWRCMQSPDYDGAISRLDVLIVAAAVAASVTLYHQGWDVAISIRHAYDLFQTIRNGEFGQFYYNVLEKALGGQYADPNIRYAAVYDFFVYFITMLIMLPFWFVTHIFKLSLGENVWLLYFDTIYAGILYLSGYLIKRIVLEMTADERVSKRTAFIYLSSFTVIYATVGFCQFDLYCVIFMELGILYYLKERYLKFALAMSAAIMLKTFPIIVFIPLVLLIEKRIAHILKYMLFCVVCPVISKIITHGDVGLSFSVKELQERYGFVNRLFANGINVGIGFGALFVVLMAVTCIWCFDHDGRAEERWKYVICVPMIVFSGFFILVYWHPSWFILMAPFFSIACGLLPRRSLLYCEWAVGLLVSVLAIIINPMNVDNYMVNYGLLPLITKHQYMGASLSSILQGIHPQLTTFISSALVAIIGYAGYCIVKDIHCMNTPLDNKDQYVKRGIVMVRPVSIYAFCVLLLTTYFYLG